jgi:hypothetical protein
MITTYLRFPSEEAWEQAAAAVGVRVNDPILVEEESFDYETGDIIPAVYEDNWSWKKFYTHDWAIDVVGVIYNDDGVYSDDGEVITPPTPMDGWHVNYKAATLPSELEAYVVTPNSPHRKFAGD